MKCFLFFILIITIIFNANFAQKYEIVNNELFILTEKNFETIIHEYDLVLANFHATWCPYSQQTYPIVSNAWKEIFPLYPGKRVIFGVLDCDLNQKICAHYNVTKYPTLKIFRLGKACTEYRKKRDVSSIKEYIIEQLEYRIKNISKDDYKNVSTDISSIFVSVPDSNPDELLYRTLHMLGFMLREDCNIFMIPGSNEILNKLIYPKYIKNQPFISYKPAHMNYSNIYGDKITELEKLSQWIIKKCTPYIREINRENAEEITEKGLPLLILFYDDKTRNAIKIFTDLVHEIIESSANGNKIQPVIAKAEAFIHPLNHLGKGLKDLPVLAIDSFAHMFAFPHPFSIFNPSPNHESHKYLKEFLDDLFSQKLHTDYHEKMNEQFQQQMLAFQNLVMERVGGDGNPNVIQNDKVIRDNNIDSSSTTPFTVGSEIREKIRKKITPPPSIFQKLQPSYTRYTLLRPPPHDEL